MQSHKAALAAAIAGVGLSFGLLNFPASVFAGLLALLAVYIAAVDLDRFIIPDVANAALFALGLGLVLSEAWPDEKLPALADALLRAGAIGGVFLALRFAHARLTGAIGLGLGDVKLAAAGAPFLSWTALPLAVALAAAAGVLAVMTRALLRRESANRKTELPFGAFLAPAIWICFVFDRIGLFLT
jgi:leader peptidase (prepilin peptidase)/N-methyltransferase